MPLTVVRRRRRHAGALAPEPTRLVVQFDRARRRPTWPEPGAIRELFAEAARVHR